MSSSVASTGLISFWLVHKGWCAMHTLSPSAWATSREVLLKWILPNFNENLKSLSENQTKAASLSESSVNTAYENSILLLIFKHHEYQPRRAVGCSLRLPFPCTALCTTSISKLTGPMNFSISKVKNYSLKKSYFFPPVYCVFMFQSMNKNFC